jgi:hypothetical protein
LTDALQVAAMPKARMQEKEAQEMPVLPETHDRVSKHPAREMRGQGPGARAAGTRSDGDAPAGKMCSGLSAGESFFQVNSFLQIAARRGTARLGLARQGGAGRGGAGRGKARIQNGIILNDVGSLAWQGWAWRGKAGLGGAGRGEVIHRANQKQLTKGAKHENYYCNIKGNQPLFAEQAL